MIGVTLRWIPHQMVRKTSSKSLTEPRLALSPRPPSLKRSDVRDTTLPPGRTHPLSGRSQTPRVPGARGRAPGQEGQGARFRVSGGAGRRRHSGRHRPSPRRRREVASSRPWLAPKPFLSRVARSFSSRVEALGFGAGKAGTARPGSFQSTGSAGAHEHEVGVSRSLSPLSLSLCHRRALTRGVRWHQPGAGRGSVFLQQGGAW